MARRLYYRGRDEVLRAARSDVAILETDVQRLWKRVGREDRQHQLIEASALEQSANCSASGGDCSIPSTLTISMTTWSWPATPATIFDDYPNHFSQTLTLTEAITSAFPDLGNGKGKRRWVGTCFEPQFTSGGGTLFKGRRRIMLRCNPSGTPGPTSPYPFLQVYSYDIWTPGSPGSWTHNNSTCDGTVYESSVTSYRQNTATEYEFTCEPFYLRYKESMGGSRAFQFEVTE